MNFLLIANQGPLADGIADFLRGSRHRVRTATSASQAVRATNAHRFHAILVDSELANGQATRLLRRFRKRPYLGKLVVLASPYELPASYQPHHIGVSAIIEKPFFLAELHCQLLDLCRPKESVIRVEDLSLDTVSARAMVNHQPLLLNHTQLQLLKLFMQNPDKVLTGALLTNHLWSQMHDPVTQSLITKHLCIIRKILQNAGCALGIVPVSTVGFRLESVNPILKPV